MWDAGRLSGVKASKGEGGGGGRGLFIPGSQPDGLRSSAGISQSEDALGLQAQGIGGRGAQRQRGSFQMV